MRISRAHLYPFGEGGGGNRDANDYGDCAVIIFTLFSHRTFQEHSDKWHRTDVDVTNKHLLNVYSSNEYPANNINRQTIEFA